MRKGDAKEKCYFRSSERVFRMNESWYFAAREGDQGPFRSEQEAVAEVKRFLNDKVELAKFQHDRETAEAQDKVAAVALELELVPLDQRPRLRAIPSGPLNRKVMI